VRQWLENDAKKQQKIRKRTTFSGQPLMPPLFTVVAATDTLRFEMDVVKRAEGEQGGKMVNRCTFEGERQVII